MLQFYDRRVLLLIHRRGERVELNAGVSGGKAPVDPGFGAMAARRPRCNFTAQSSPIGHSTGQALLGQRRDLAFRHVEPTAMFGGVGKCPLAGEPSRFGGRQSFIERGGRRRVEIIDHQAHHFRVRERPIDQLLHLPGKGTRCASGGDVDLTPAPLRLPEEEQIRPSLTAIFIVIAGGLSGSGRQRVTYFADQLHRTLVETDLRAARLVRFGIQVQDLFPIPDKGRTPTGNAPLFVLPGVELVFFSARRTVSSEIPSPVVSSTNRSASSCRVQRARPAGGVLQARATKKASGFPSSFGRPLARRRALSAGANPSATNRGRVRWIGERPTRHISAISSSLRPSAAWSSMGARAIFRAEALPCLSNPPRSSCSAAVKSTRYFSDLAPSSLGRYPTASRLTCQNLCGDLLESIDVIVGVWLDWQQEKWDTFY